MKAEAEPEDQRVPAYSWYALGVLALVYMFNFIDRQILSILANDIRADLGIDDAQLGFLYGTAFAVFYALFGIPLGQLSDNWQRTRLLAIGVALWSFMTVLSGLARNFTTLTFARVGVGVGEASANPCAYSLIGDWFPAHARGTALALYSAGLFVGSGVSLVLGGAIVEGWEATFPQAPPLGLAGWQAAFIAVGLPGLALAAWVISLREPTRDSSSQARQAPLGVFLRSVAEIVPPLTLLSAFRRAGWKGLATNIAFLALVGLVAAILSRALGNAQQFAFVAIGYYAVFSWASIQRRDQPETFRLTWAAPAFMALVVAYSAVSFAGYSITYWAAPYAERSFELGKSELGWLIGAPNAVGGFAGVILGGWLADRLVRRFVAGRAMVIGIAMTITVPAVLAGYASDELTTFLVCNFIAQMATASALGASAAATQALVRPEMRGTATAVFLLGPTLMSLAFGPFTTGYISEATGNLGFGIRASLLAFVPGLLAVAIGIRAYRGALDRAAIPAG